MAKWLLHDSCVFILWEMRVWINVRAFVCMRFCMYAHLYRICMRKKLYTLIAFIFIRDEFNLSIYMQKKRAMKGFTLSLQKQGIQFSFVYCQFVQVSPIAWRWLMLYRCICYLESICKSFVYIYTFLQVHFFIWVLTSFQLQLFISNEWHRFDQMRVMTYVWGWNK